MSRYNDTGHLTETPDGDIPLYARVKKTATGVDVAAAADKTYGSALRRGFEPDPEKGQEDISVKIFSAAGTHFAIAGGAIQPGEEIQGADDGKVVAVTDGPAIGLCIEEATADGQVIEVVYYSPTAEPAASESEPDPDA